MTDNNDKILAAIIGTDLARLAIPKPPDINKIIINGDLTAKLQLMAKQMSSTVETQQSIIGLAPQLSAIAKAIEQKYQPQITAFQTIAQKLQPLMSQQSKFAQDISKITSQVSPALDAIKTLSSYNAFQRYKQTYEEFGGDLDPENFTEEEVERTIEDNREIINEVNEVLLHAENDGITPGDVPELIYSFLIKRVPNLSKRTYGIIVLIFCTTILAYELHSAHSTNTTLEEKVEPALKEQLNKLEQNTKDHQKAKHGITDNSKEIKTTQEKLDSTKAAVNDLNEDFNTYQEETNDKLDLILEKMRKQDNTKTNKKHDSPTLVILNAGKRADKK